MRRRRLFIFLCALLTQLNASEQLSSRNGDRPDTISSNQFDGNAFFGDEPIFGREFSSGMGKIRRVRSVDDDLKKAVDEFDKAKEEEKVLESKMSEAERKHKKAVDELKKTNDTLKEALEKLKTIDADLETASSTNSTAYGVKFTAEANVATFTTEVNTSTIAFDTAESTLAELETASSLNKTEYERQKTLYGDATEARKNAATNASGLSGDLLRLEGELKGQIETWKTSNDSLNAAEKESRNNNQTIQDFNDYEEIKKKGDDAAKKEKELRDGILLKYQGAVTNLGKKKKMLDKNRVLMKTPPQEWKAMTVDQAINYCAQIVYNITKKYNSTIDKKAQGDIDKFNAFKGQLEQLKTFGFTQKVKELVNDYSNLKTQVDKDINDAKQNVTDTEKNILIQATIKNDSTNNLTALATRLGKTLTKIDDDGRLANRNQAALDKKFFDEFAKNGECRKNVEGKTKEVSAVKRQSKQANETLTIKAENEKELGYAEGNWTQAKGIAENYKNNVFVKAKEKKEAAESNKGEWEEKRGEAILDYNNADEEAKKLIKQKGEVNQLIKELKEEKLTKEGIERTRGDELLKAFLNHRSKQQEVTSLDEKKNTQVGNKAEAVRKEKEHKDMISSLTTWLGVAVGLIIIIVVGGILAFVLIRRRKRKAVVTVPVAPVIDRDRDESLWDYYYTDNDNTEGIKAKTYWKKDKITGEVKLLNPECVPESAFKKMGVIKFGGLTDHFPEKHRMEDQTGGEIMPTPQLDFNQLESYQVEGEEYITEDSIDPDEPKEPPADLNEEDEKKYQALSNQLVDLQCKQASDGTPNEEKIGLSARIKKLQVEYQPLKNRKTRFEMAKINNDYAREKKEQREKKMNSKSKRQKGPSSKDSHSGGSGESKTPKKKK